MGTLIIRVFSILKGCVCDDLVAQVISSCSNRDCEGLDDENATAKWVSQPILIIVHKSSCLTLD